MDPRIEVRKVCGCYPLGRTVLSRPCMGMNGIRDAYFVGGVRYATVEEAEAHLAAVGNARLLADIDAMPEEPQPRQRPWWLTAAVLAAALVMLFNVVVWAVMAYRVLLR